MIAEQTEEFEKDVKKIDNSLKLKLKKKIEKIIQLPELGKPLEHLPKVFSERIEGYRIIYEFKNERILFLCFKNRDNVYNYLKEKL